MKFYLKESFAYLPRVIIIFASIALLIYIAVFTTPPDSWEAASTIQILTVFLPLLIISTLLIDLFLKYLPRSFILGMGIMVIFVLQALRQLTFLVALGIILVAVLSARLFPKIKIKEVKDIPKLGLSKKTKESTLPRLRRRHRS